MRLSTRTTTDAAATWPFAVAVPALSDQTNGHRAALSTDPSAPAKTCHGLDGSAPSIRDIEVAAGEATARATDPTASLISFQLNDWYTARLHGTDGSANQIVFRAAIPFTLGATNHIFRITQPYVTSSPSGATGVVDTTLFDLAVFGAPWGRWGLGLSGTVPTGAQGLSTEKYTLGPALGFVNASDKRFNWGVFTQSFFSFAGDDDAPRVGVVNLQPIFSWQLGQGRSLSLGNSAFVCDTAKSRWASLMLGLNYGQVVSFAGQMWRPNFEMNYDFRGTTSSAQWVLRIGVALLVPSP